MKVLITGGAGFIGSHLSERHLQCGHQVCIIDDLSTGTIANIEHIKSHPNFTYHIDTIMHEELMSELVDACDVVHHLAASVGVRLIVEAPVRTIETNIRGTELVLKLAAKKKKRVLITSSSEVYGKRTQVPFRETDDLILGPTSKARWSYACSKAIDEFLALAYWKEKGVPTVAVRLFNTVGPRQTGRYGMVVPTFVQQALAGQDITVYGDGAQSRCFTHVSDVVNALVAIIAHPDAVGEVYNIGNTREVTILQLAQRVKRLTDSESEIVFVPYEQAYGQGFEDMMRRVPDISKAHKLIGYSPAVHLDETLQTIIDYQRSSRTLPQPVYAPGWTTA
jgi:UDP-glucose 4-epimerase